MMNKKNITSLVVNSALFALAASFLINYNLERNFSPDQYIAAEKAYFVEKDIDQAGLVKAKKFVVPTDDEYNTQKKRSLGSNLIGDIESVWSSYTGEGTTIAIIDDGFDYNHPEFTRSDGTSAILNTSRNYFTSGSTVYYQAYSTNNAYIGQDWEDGAWSTHGTQTSTTAMAPMNNGGGVGIAPNASILALKVDFYLSSIRAAILYAIEQNVDVINMSLGAYAETFTDGFGDLQEGYSSTATYLNNVTLQAYNAGIIVVAAAGNEATWRKSYPASNSHVIGVGALGDWTNKGNANELAEFTNYVSASQTGEVNVDILAPGYVYTAKQAGTQYSPTHTYGDTQGTSFSSPIIAGAAALWKQKYPTGTPSEFLTELQNSADGKGFYTNKMIKVSGWDSSRSDVGPSNITNGRVNVANLLDMSAPHVNVKQSSFNISLGETRQINLDTYNGTISYSSNSTNIATVNNSGLIEAISAGQTQIVVTATKNGQTATATVDVNVIGITSANELTFNPPTITLNVGDTYNAEETITTSPIDASRIFMFDSADSSIATVNEDTGVITAIGVGATEIEVIAIYGDGYATLEVIVNNSNPVTGTLNFGNGAGRLHVSSANFSGTDDLTNPWTIKTTGTTSFTPNAEYSQLGSSKSPASTIEFKMTLPTTVTFTAVSATFGGFSGSSAAVSIKVGTTQIGSGSVPDSADRTISSTSTATGNTLIINLSNISKGIKAYSISYSYTGGGPIEPPTLENVNVTNTKTYHPGEVINKNDINVSLAYSDGSVIPTTDFTFANNGYMFTYDDAFSGGSNSTKQFSITYEGTQYNFFVNVVRNPYIFTPGSTTTLSSSQFNSSNISKSIDIPSNPLVTIGGINFSVTTNAYIFSQSGYYLSFGKGSGSIRNTSAFSGALTSVSVTQKSGARQDGDLSVSEDGNTWITYTSEILSSRSYYYFKYEYTTSSGAGDAAGYSNIQTIIFTLAGQDNANAVANYIMFEDTNNQCLTKLDIALGKLNNMSSTNKNSFWTSEDYVIATARERLLAWARHEGTELTYSNGNFELNNADYVLSIFANKGNFELIPLIIISLIGIVSINGYLLIKRKRNY